MSSKQIGQLSGASTKSKVPSGVQGMLKVDLVRSVSQNLVWVPSSCIPWHRYCLLVFTAVQALVTSSMKLVEGMDGGLMQWVMMQGGRTEFWADGTIVGSPHGSQDFRHLQLVFNWTVSPSPFPVVSNFDPSVKRYPTSALYQSSPSDPTIQVLLAGGAVGVSLGSFSGIGRGSPQLMLALH